MANSISTFLIVVCLCLTYVGVDAIREQDEYGAPSNFESYINSTLVPPAGNSIQKALLGVGYQIYTYNGTAWPLTNVSADLFNFVGDRVGYHFDTEPDAGGGQATWEIFKPFSRVTTRNVVLVPQSDAIGWLLNIATSNSGSRKCLGSTTYVQRLYTHEGLGPAADVPGYVGEAYYSYYHAIYVYLAPSS